ncbi:MAG: lipid-A-disaccharide synthase-related protein [bacterium]|nr:lipid-A-disaccharide synthase-related protein [bacterium]
MKPRLLFISNGYSEDMMAAAMAAALRSGADVDPEGLPLVGPGVSYLRAGIPVNGPAREMPPGAGFSIRDRHLARIRQDLRSGLIGLVASQTAYIRRAGRAGCRTVAVGDAYALWMALRGCEAPVFVDTPISAYIRPHRRLEIALMRRAKAIFTRDEPTAEELRGRGLDARFAGSPMLDCLETTGLDLGSAENVRIALLPGSRLEAYDNLEVLLRIAERTAAAYAAGLDFLLAMAPTLDTERLGLVIRQSGWHCDISGIDTGVVAEAVYGSARLTVVRGAFGDLLAAADLVIGQAGTASEQAVGMGCPLLAFPGRGPQVSEGFLRTQKRLLGDAMELLPADEEVVARRTLELLGNRQQLDSMSRTGRDRMGGGGGVRAIAGYLANAMC